MGEKKIVILFPGANYSTECPLLYYAGFKFEVRGYEKLSISYDNLHKQDKPFEELIIEVGNVVLSQLLNFDLTKYDDIVFVSKSVGTIIDGWTDEKMSNKVRHIYLTPLKETLPYIKRKNNIIAVIAGKEDRYLDAEILKNHCTEDNINLTQIDGAGHSLEVWGDMDRNLQILKEVVKIY